MTRPLLFAASNRLLVPSPLAGQRAARVNEKSGSARGGVGYGANGCFRAKEELGTDWECKRYALNPPTAGSGLEVVSGHLVWINAALGRRIDMHPNVVQVIDRV